MPSLQERAGTDNAPVETLAMKLRSAALKMVTLLP
jgi:hypothetical protein